MITFITVEDEDYKFIKRYREELIKQGYSTSRIGRHKMENTPGYYWSFVYFRRVI